MTSWEPEECYIDNDPPPECEEAQLSTGGMAQNMVAVTEAYSKSTVRISFL